MDLIDISMDYYFTEHFNINRDDLIEINDEHRAHNSTIEVMINLIANKNIERIKELLELDKDQRNIINLVDKDNETLLHFSVFSNNYDLSRLFLKYGADPNKRDNEGQTAIFRIVFATDERIIGLLLEYGAILDLQDKDGNTALHIAVLTKNYKIIKSLLDYGVDPLITNKSNLISLDFAVTQMNDKIIFDDHILSIFSNYIK